MRNIAIVVTSVSLLAMVATGLAPSVADQEGWLFSAVAQTAAGFSFQDLFDVYDAPLVRLVFGHLFSHWGTRVASLASVLSSGVFAALTTLLLLRSGRALSFSAVSALGITITRIFLADSGSDWVATDTFVVLSLILSSMSVGNLTWFALGILWANLGSFPLIGVVLAMLSESGFRGLAAYAAGTCLNPFGLRVLAPALIDLVFRSSGYHLPIFFQGYAIDLSVTIAAFISLTAAVLVLLYGVRGRKLLCAFFGVFLPIRIVPVVLVAGSPIPTRIISSLGFVFLCLIGYQAGISTQQLAERPEGALQILSEVLPSSSVATVGRWADRVQSRFHAASTWGERRRSLWKLQARQRKQNQPLTDAESMMVVDQATAIVFPIREWRPSRQSSWILMYEDPVAGIAIKRDQLKEFGSSIARYYRLQAISWKEDTGFVLADAYRENQEWVELRESWPKHPNASFVKGLAQYYLERGVSSRSIELLEQAVNEKLADAESAALLVELLLSEQKLSEVKSWISRIDALKLKHPRIGSAKIYLESGAGVSQALPPRT